MVKGKSQMTKYALLIIDMQKDFVLPESPSAVKNSYETIPAILKALNFFRKMKLPVFHVVREYREDGSDIEHIRLDKFMAGAKSALPGSRGCEIVDELKPLPSEYRLVKQRFSAFMNTELDFMLRRLNVTDIAVCGTQYPNCIRTTVFDGISYGYNVTVLTDATSAKTEEVARANIFDMEQISVKCINVEEFIDKSKKSI